MRSVYVNLEGCISSDTLSLLIRMSCGSADDGLGLA